VRPATEVRQDPPDKGACGCGGLGAYYRVLSASLSSSLDKRRKMMYTALDKPAHKPTPGQCPLDGRTTDANGCYREHNAAPKFLRFIWAKDWLRTVNSRRKSARGLRQSSAALPPPVAISYLGGLFFFFFFLVSRAKTAANLAIDLLRQRGLRLHVTAMPTWYFAGI